MGLLSGPLQMVLQTHVSEEMRGDEVILGGWEVGFGIGGRVVGVWGGWGGRGWARRHRGGARGVPR